MRSMTVASLPRIPRFRRVPKISVILSAVRHHKPSSQLRSNSLRMGKLRLKMKLRQRRHVVDGEEGIVGLAEADLRPLELLLDKAVAVEVVGGLEREERGHPHHHRAQGFVAEVEVVVCEAAALAGEDPVIWILGGVFGGADAKARPLLHALEDGSFRPSDRKISNMFG